MENRGKVLLDLYITHWTEPWEVGRPAFQMLGLQRGVNWDEIRVTVVHDGVPAFWAEYFEGLPFAVQQVCIPHGGPSGARNWGIDHGEAEWIKWCDFDDLFYGVYSLRRLMDAIHRAENFDLLWFEMVGEDLEGVQRLWKERDPVVIHGKAFRRSFLREHGIRFNPELTWCEDSAFLAVVEMEIDHQRIGKVTAEGPIYAYIARDGSLCNRKEIRFDNMRSFFRRHCYVQSEFLKRHLMEPYYTMTARIMGDCYKHLFLAGVTEDTGEYREEILEYWRRHRADLFRLRRDRYDLALAAVDRESWFPDENGKLVQKPVPREGLKAWLREMTAEIRRRGLEFEAAAE